MKTMILPGYSISNKDWAEEVAKNIAGSQVHYWKHWQDGKTSVRDEIGEVEREIGSNNFNVIAKSIGTLVFCLLLPKVEKQIQKIILCGIPLNDIAPDLDSYKVLRNIDPNKILVIQNSEDPHGSYKQVAEFLGNIDPQIKIISKPASDHNYPYNQEFKNFLD